MSDPVDEHEAETPEVAEKISFDVPNSTSPRQEGSLLMIFQIIQAQIQNQFLAALRRTISGRGWCKKIISDNQLNFKKAEKLVQLSIANDLGKDLHDESVQSFLAENGITWVYITERSPHCGAFYERLNHSLKEPLTKILGKARLNYTKLYTILTGIEATLNQRPLTYLGSDPRNPQAITPSHLAIGRALKTVPNSQDDPRISVSKHYMNNDNQYAKGIVNV